MAFGETIRQEDIVAEQRRRTRLSLACLLLKARTLFLDEPTNHLDIGTLKYDEQYLKSYKGHSIILVSPDRYFLDG